MGSSSLISFLPEVGLGVGVLVNTDVGGAALAQLVTADVFDRLLGGDAPDALPTLLQEARRIRAGTSEAEEYQNPVVGDGLSLPPRRVQGPAAGEQPVGL